MIKILYAGRSDSPHFLRRLFKKIQNTFVFTDQDGFFEESLETLGAAYTKTYLQNIHSLKLKCDQLSTQAVIINLKCLPFQSAEEWQSFFSLSLREKNITKALFINAAQAEYMLTDDILDTFDVVFKREPFKDRSRYVISEANRAKIVPTMISCPFVHAPRDNWLSKAYHLVRPTVAPYQPGEEKYDIGFSGADAAEHSLRRDAWSRVVAEDFSHIGGLQPNPYTGELIPKELQGPRFKGRAYRDALCQARINLALDGIGQYTFRHQELLYLGKFILSSPTIRELELPMPLEEGKHYVAFNDLDDMVEKIRYYLAHEDERNQIATAGQALFQEYYNPKCHGREILAVLERVNRVKR